MSKENIDAMKRGAEAFNRRDIDAMLEEVDSEIEWAAALPVILGGETTVSRGHEAVREMFRDLFDVLDDIRVEYTDFHELGDRLFCAGHIWTRGRESGAETESPYFAVVGMKHGKAVRMATYLDLDEALEAARLEE
jgi:ketosteroid isomerase-like protein